MPSKNLKTRGQLTFHEKRALAQLACDEHNYNPFKELIEMAQETEEIEVNGESFTVHSATKDQRISIAKEIASYLAPKIKNEERAGHKGDLNFNITLKQFGAPEDNAIEADVTES